LEDVKNGKVIYLEVKGCKKASPPRNDEWWDGPFTRWLSETRLIKQDVLKMTDFST